MTPQQSTLRISALYHARGMISQSDYRDFRCEYLRAVINGGELPELPDAWHHVAPGTHTATADDDESTLTTGPRNLPPLVVAVALAAVVIVIGGWILMINMG
ncbi:MAG: hypothetical protein OET44_10160 [Gammaproteobacteria bacterium]|nr:hypothetical protein [Gammaproteobacteria bacterium]